MAIIRWEPFNEIERFFDDRSLPLLPAFRRLGWDLAADVYEEKGNIVARMSLPGIRPEEVEITLEGDILTVSGRRDEEQEVERKDYYSKEIRRGSFARSISLPKPADGTNAEAAYADGVLTVTLPALPGAKEKAIKVKVKK